MIQVCYFCRQIYGEKEPLEDKQETHGECSLCHFLFAIWYSCWKKGGIDETATAFILRCREILGEKCHEGGVVR